MSENLEDKKLIDINKFRNDNFFDCHSTNKIQSDIPPHKCIHKFTLTENMQQQPVNCDAFGISRCIICNQPMKNQCDVHSKSTSCYNQGGVDNKSKAKNISKYYNEGLFPKKINIGCGCENIQLKIPKEYLSELGDLSPVKLPSKTKKNAPVNSFALRFQRGVI